MATRFDDVTKGQCLADDCERGIRSRGMCGMHYQRQHDHGSLEKRAVVGWCKGLTAATDERIRIGAAKMAMSKRGSVPWNKGLTAIDSRVDANEHHRRAARKYRVAHPLAAYARQAVQIRQQGDPSWKPEACQRCNSAPAASRNLQAHHHHGYERAHWLDVIWLCLRCHGLEHREAA